jgi:hypothetical protein
MNSKYYVAVRGQLNETHSVHKEGCPFLPDQEKRIYLGEFTCINDAIKEGQQYFNRSKGCIFCSDEHGVHKENLTSAVWISEILPAAIDIPLSCQESLSCCLN